MKFARPQHPHEAHFDITAMIDIVLLLIIFFCFTAQFSRTLLTPMDLPREKGAAAASTAPRTVTIDLTRAGTTRVMGREVDHQWLLQTLAKDIKAAGSADNLEVVIRADRRCPASHLNNLAGALSTLGIRSWKLATAEEGA